MSKVLMKGNEAIAEAAIQAGCKAFFGYPITPQNEIPEYMARKLALNNGVFVQAESEISAINMVYGAASSGVRVMTSSSSPGIALKQEGISYLAGSELPAVIVSVTRGGPGLGGILPSQADYFQATRGGGNGDYQVIVYAPKGVQEATNLVQKAFDTAEKYRNPVMVIADGVIGQMMEPVELSPSDAPEFDRSWAATGESGTRGHRNVVNSLYLDPKQLEDHNIRLQAKYKKIEEQEVMYETIGVEDAEVALVAYGTPSRIAMNAMSQLNTMGIKTGLIRPITLWPFPKDVFAQLPASVKHVVVCELSMGQLVQDVRLYTKDEIPVHHYGRAGGMIFTPQEIIDFVKEVAGGNDHA